MKKIQLTKGQFAICDDEDYDNLRQCKWYAHWNHETKSYYAVTNITIDSIRSALHMSRVVMNAGYKQIVDHINHNTLDNTKNNLRLCNCSENGGNSRKHKKTSSKYKGVCWHKRAKKWQASIRFNYMSIHIGYFILEIDAALAYDKEACYYFGEFAYLNFPYF